MALNRTPHDPYVNAVFDAMLDVPQPETCWSSDAETASDGENCTLSAVFIWRGEVSPDHYPDGLLICWDLEAGWQYAGNRPDGSNDYPEDLPLPMWAEPGDVAEAARALLRGQPVPESDDEWSDPEVFAAVKAWEES